jgi:curved DNA-binding protein CbpA
MPCRSDTRCASVGTAQGPAYSGPTDVPMPVPDRTVPGETLRDPYEVLGLDQGTSRDVVERTARRLQRELHPDRFPDADAVTIAATTRGFAEVNEAVHILTDAKALQRYRARQARERRGSATPNEPGRDGVRFTAAPPTAGSAVAPSPGDPDFDYRERARSEFDLRRLPDPMPPPWTARPPKPRRGSRQDA